jgi:predicted enzyme related to lactoylglutathione lyase
MDALHLKDVRTVAVPVEDQDRAVAFYRNTLGCEVRMDAVLGGEMRWIEVSPTGANTSIALVASGEGLPTGVDTGIRLVTGDAAADFEALTSAGVDMNTDLLLWEGVPPMFSFRDVDGNTLYVAEG